VAAVIGSRVPYAVLAGVYSQARRLAQQLTYLVGTGVLAIDEHDPQQPFRFSPTLLRDVAYNSILYAQRRELHGRVARRIEQLYPELLDMYSTELAHHYQLAEVWPLSFAYSLRAGRYARARNATAEALAAYRQANDLAAAHPGAIGPANRVAALEELADSEVLAGLYDAAHQHLRTLLALRVDAPVPLASVRRKVGNVYEHQGQLDAALNWLRRAHELLVAHGDAALDQARVLSDIGWVCFRRNEFDEARDWLQQAAALLEGPPPKAAWADVEAERAMVQNRLGGAAWMTGDTAQAQRYVERALSSFEALGDLIGQGLALNNLGILAEQRGDWSQAITAYEGALHANSQIGRRREAALNRLNLGIAALHRGNIKGALPALEQAAQQLAAVADALHEVMALRWLARALTQDHRFATAHETLDRALILARRHNLPLERLDVFTARAELALAQGDINAANAALASAQQVQPEVDPASFEVGLFLRLAARLALHNGDHAQAGLLLEEACAIFAELGMAQEVAATNALQLAADAR
ncbi:MAG: tetratricopeptide repeat protein, partial [Chloroflexales bacterium]|nr:tetratricopeptide repeat protein [Chloroflexales bacterium]